MNTKGEKIAQLRNIFRKSIDTANIFDLQKSGQRDSCRKDWFLHLSVYHPILLFYLCYITYDFKKMFRFHAQQGSYVNTKIGLELMKYDRRGQNYGYTEIIYDINRNLKYKNLQYFSTIILKNVIKR